MPKPFDMEAAKRGEPLESWAGEPLTFIGVASNGDPVVEDRQGRIETALDGRLRMSDPPRRCFVNVYEDLFTVSESEDIARSLKIHRPFVIAIGIEIAADGTASIFKQGEKR